MKLIYSAIAMLVAVSAPLLGAEITIPRWQPHDFEFHSPVTSGNPFQITFTADVTGPDGTKLNLPGFYDGNEIWKIRLSPTAAGTWSLVTHSANPSLDSQHELFECVPNPSPIVHGPLQIDPSNRHQFMFEDGTHFLPMGYECDWLWALDATDPELKAIHPFLDKLTQSGFNLIIFDTFAQDTSWRKGKTADDDFGPPPIYPWEGANDHPEFNKFNLAYWQHFDRVMQALNDRGIIAHLLLRVYNKQVTWPTNGSAEDDLYFRWLIARYSAYPNVTWDLSKEAQHEKDLNYKINRLQFIRANDPYHRLLTIHDDQANYDKGAYDDVVDYRSDQQHLKWRETMLAHLAQRNWPVINTEFGYEQGAKGANDKTYSKAQDAGEVCRRAWEVYTAGGSGVYYYTYTAWDILRPQDTPPGYAYFKHLHEFFEGTGYWRMKPTTDLVTNAYCLADPGHEYVVFLNQAAPFTLRLESVRDSLPAEWYQPLSGTRQDIGAMRNGNIEMKPPSDWGGAPIVLHVGSAKN